ncbi:MAG: glutamate--tRNA ligase family protein [Clostridia bacterium]|nr:glutamate--tRNA ligase family protein [Clostridia bacterium]
MDNKKLADLLFPALPHDADYYLEKYKKRNLQVGAQITRFAPSPTGFLHIGHFFQALVDSRIAKSTGGIFYFRLEDTDKKREKTGSGIVALQVMKEFGLEPNEGLTEDGKDNGNYGPYTQSLRTDIYKAFAKKLVAEGKAFPCFCEKKEDLSEIVEKRELMLEETNSIAEKDVCRNLSFDEIANNLKQKKPFAIRLKSSDSENKTILVDDVIYGKRPVPANNKDGVLLKSDGLPTYAFAHPIDDHLMKTTLVVRGSDWYSSVAFHLDVFENLGFEKIPYAHTALICKNDELTGNKRKLSKRFDPEADMRYFILAGYPNNAVIEYLLNLANSNFEIWRAKNPDVSNEEFMFNPKKLSTSSPMLDLAKLDDISKTIISKMTTQELFEKLKDWAIRTNEFNEIIDSKPQFEILREKLNTPLYKIILENPDFVKAVLSIDREKKNPRKDIINLSHIYDYFKYMFDSGFELNFGNKFDKNLIKKVLMKYKNLYNEKDSKDDWFDKIKKLGAEFNFATDMKEYKANPEKFVGNLADLTGLIRIAITGQENSPDIYEIMKILGNAEVYKRFNFAIKN